MNRGESNGQMKMSCAFKRSMTPQRDENKISASHSFNGGEFKESGERGKHTAGGK